MYKFTDSSNRVVSDGKGWSGLITVPEVQAWLAEGNTPLPADPDPVPSPTAVIETLERSNMLPRPAREFMLGLMEREAVAAGAARTPPLTKEQSIAVLRAGNAGYRKVKELDEQIVTERAKL